MLQIWLENEDLHRFHTLWWNPKCNTGITERKQVFKNLKSIPVNFCNRQLLNQQKPSHKAKHWCCVKLSFWLWLPPSKQGSHFLCGCKMNRTNRKCPGHHFAGLRVCWKQGENHTVLLWIDMNKLKTKYTQTKGISVLDYSFPWFQHCVCAIWFLSSLRDTKGLLPTLMPPSYITFQVNRV